MYTYSLTVWKVFARLLYLLSQSLSLHWLRGDSGEDSKNQGTRKKKRVVCVRSDEVVAWWCGWGRPRRARRWFGRGVSIPAGRVRRGGGRGRRRAEWARTTRAVRSRPPAKRLPSAAATSAQREPSVATFDIHRATTRAQPQIASLTGIALVLSLQNYWKLVVTTAFSYHLDSEMKHLKKWYKLYLFTYLN